MYQSIIQTMIESLVAREFYLSSALGSSKLLENSAVLLLKEEAPVLYIVALIPGSMEEVEKHQTFMEGYLKHLQQSLSQYYCKKIIALTIIIDDISVENKTVQNIVDFVDNKIFLPEGDCFHVWWYVSVAEKTIRTGKGQPDKILDLKQVVLNALEQDGKKEPMESLREIAYQAKKNTAFQLKSKNALLTWHLFLLNLLVLGCMFLTGDTEKWIVLFGNNQEAVFVHGEYYRLLTACFIHSGFLHLLQNAIYLGFFGTRTELLYGKGMMAVLYFAAGIGGNLLSAGLHTAFSVGASGAIFGLLGAVLVYSHENGKRSVGMKYSTLLLLVVIALGFGYLEPNVDYLGHLGGFLIGVVLSFFYLRWEKHKLSTEKKKSYPQDKEE